MQNSLMGLSKPYRDNIKILQVINKIMHGIIKILKDINKIFSATIQTCVYHYQKSNMALPQSFSTINNIYQLSAIKITSVIFKITKSLVKY